MAPHRAPAGADEPSGPTESGAPVRRFRHVVLGGLLVEAVALAAVAVLAGWQMVSRGSRSPGTGGALAVLTLAVAAVLVLAGRAYARGGRGRGFVVTWQLVLAGSAGTIIGARPATAFLVVAWGVVVVAALVVVAAVADAAREPRGPALER